MPQSPALVSRAKRDLARLRWMSKRRTVVNAGGRPFEHLGHVLWSPELESFSYDLADPEGLAVQVARILGVDEGVVLAHLAELDEEPELGERLRRATRFRWHVRTQPRPGNRVLWHLLLRSLRPALVVETGIYDGLGTIVLVAALRRNAEEGYPGHVVSVDPDPRAARLVPDRLADGWTWVRDTSQGGLEAALAGRPVDVLFSDSPHTRENQEFEFGLARRHAPRGPQVLVDGSGGWSPVLAELAEREGAPLHTVPTFAKDHFYDKAASGVVVLDPRADQRAAPHLAD